jgi:putative endonuclease
MKKLWYKPKKPAAKHLAVGQFGEKLAAEYLAHTGYQLVASNFTTPIGYSLHGRSITGEIDLVAYDKTAQPFTLVFVEVKTRSSKEFAAPQAAVDLRKQRQIIKTARIYRRLLRVTEEPFRYDVVSILLHPKQTAEIELLRDYFSETTFARSHWHRREF